MQKNFSYKVPFQINYQYVIFWKENSSVSLQGKSILKSTIIYVNL